MKTIILALQYIGLYLTNNEWRPLKDENIVSDGTEGFFTTGIIKIDVPADASDHNTIITDGLIWFCASVSKFSNRIPMLVDVVAQAVEAKFEDNGNDQSHFDMALKAGSISKLSVAVAEIAKVDQPFASFDGKHKEIGKEFYTRVSERLRHKGRAITAWDYEHLILDRFPSIYKVKCITHTDPNCFCRHPLETLPPAPVATDCGIGKVDIIFVENDIKMLSSGKDIKSIADQMANSPDCRVSITFIDNELNERRIKVLMKAIGNEDRIDPKPMPNGDPNTFNLEGKQTIPVKPKNTEEPCCGPQIAPGHVLIIPISDLKNRNAVNPLQPKTSRRTILEIEKYIAARTSPFVKVHVRNPLYEQVLVYFKVKFFPGFDKGYYLKKLNEEIVHYLTPWAFDANAEVKFGQKIYASSVINFIEERPYVDFITDFLMFVCRDECCSHPPVTEPADTKEPLAATISFIADPAASDLIAGEIIDTRSGKPITGVSMTIKGTKKQTTTGATGAFSLPPEGADPVLTLSIEGYQPQDVKVEAGKSTDIIEFVPSKEVVVVGHAISGIKPGQLSKGCGCSEVEYVLESSPSFIGETVAIPSTPRSILVSVPQHIIIPFEEPLRPSTCDERKKEKMKLAANKPEVKTLPPLKKPDKPGKRKTDRSRKPNG